MRKHMATRRPGFTVVELLIATALMAVLMAAAGAALSGMISQVNANDGLIDMRQGSQMVLDQISNKIRRAKRVQLKPDNTTDNPTNTNYSRIEILDSGVWDAKTTDYTNQKWTVFAVSGSTLTVGQGATTTPTMGVVLTGISSMVFHGVKDAGDFKNVTVALTLTKKSIKSASTGSYSLATSASIRAQKK